MSVFIEYKKKTIYFRDIVIFVKSFWYKCIGCIFFLSVYSEIKNKLKIYLKLYFQAIGFKFKEMFLALKEKNIVTDWKKFLFQR